MSSHRNAPSFSRLRDVLPSVPAALEPQSPDQPSVQTTTNEIESLPDATFKEGSPSESSDSTVAALPLSVRSALPAKPGKRKSAVKTATFRMPVDLLDALRAVADYNNLNQGDIVSESLFLHLQNFTWPPGVESAKLRDKLLQLS